MAKSLSRLGVGEPIDVLRRYHSVILRAYETMYTLTKDSNAEALTEALDAIEWCDDQMREYLYEEAAAAVGDYDPDFQGIVFNENLPEDLKLVPTERGFAIKNVPVWMLGHGARKKKPPLYHKDRPYVRKRQLWYWILRKLKEDHMRQHWKTHPVPDYPPMFSRMVVVFRSKRDYDISDLDHYPSLLQVVVNAMRLNGLIRGDRPGSFTYALEWEEDEVSVPVVDFFVEWSHTSVPAWDVDRSIVPLDVSTGDTLTTEDTSRPAADGECRNCYVPMELSTDGAMWTCPQCGLQRKNRKTAPRG